MNKLFLLLLLSLFAFQGMAAYSLPAHKEIVVVKKEPILDNGSTNPPVKPPVGSNTGNAPIK